MPKLKCTAEQCMYNMKKYCLRNRIHVQGEYAKNQCETQCGTFKLSDKKKNDDVEFGVINEANEHLSINCDALKCKYNHNELCVKENVQISGTNAECRQQTLCDSFEKIDE